MYSLKRLPVWLSRIGYCRGFGVQSPWVYSFIRYVINEHCHYYAYEELKKTFPDITRRDRKLCELYLRIANYRQAGKAIDYMPESHAYQAYINAGCRKTQAETLDSPGAEALHHTGTIELLRMSLRGEYTKFFAQAREKAADGSIFIIQGIKRGRQARDFWKHIVADEKCTITLDLYYCGIIYFDSKRYKQKYKVNF